MGSLRESCLEDFHKVASRSGGGAWAGNYNMPLGRVASFGLAEEPEQPTASKLHLVTHDHRFQRSRRNPGELAE